MNFFEKKTMCVHNIPEKPFVFKKKFCYWSSSLQKHIITFSFPLCVNLTLLYVIYGVVTL